MGKRASSGNLERRMEDRITLGGRRQDKGKESDAGRRCKKKKKERSASQCAVGKKTNLTRKGRNQVVFHT